MLNQLFAFYEIHYCVSSIDAFSLSIEHQYNAAYANFFQTIYFL